MNHPLYHLDGKVIQFQVVPNEGNDEDEKGRTIYVLTENGDMYYFDTSKTDEVWVLMYKA